MDPAVLSELARLVGRCCQLRQAAIGAEGAKALALFRGRHRWLSVLGDGNASTGSSKSSSERWREIIKVGLRKGGEAVFLCLSLGRTTPSCCALACYSASQFTSFSCFPA